MFSTTLRSMGHLRWMNDLMMKTLNNTNAYLNSRWYTQTSLKSRSQVACCEAVKLWMNKYCKYLNTALWINCFKDYEGMHHFHPLLLKLTSYRYKLQSKLLPVGFIFCVNRMLQDFSLYSLPTSQKQLTKSLYFGYSVCGVYRSLRMVDTDRHTHTHTHAYCLVL